jgi:hypothetical protein
MPQSALGVFLYISAGLFFLCILAATVVALLVKPGQLRPETPTTRAQRQRVEALNAQRGRTMALGLAASSWGFALGMLVSTLAKRRLPAEEVEQLVPRSESGPNMPYLDSSSQDSNSD